MYEDILEKIAEEIKPLKNMELQASAFLRDIDRKLREMKVETEVSITLEGNVKLEYNKHNYADNPWAIRIVDYYKYEICDAKRKYVIKACEKIEEFLYKLLEEIKNESNQYQSGR